MDEAEEGNLFLEGAVRCVESILLSGAAIALFALGCEEECLESSPGLVGYGFVVPIFAGIKKETGVVDSCVGSGDELVFGNGLLSVRGVVETIL